ncbi:MAG: citrate synthase/methylcitrate synthase [Caulobacteraceae bacterium]|nr:citrate synthase/methylcitrate synthase [Caulobacteraceae bacterium]
MSDGLEDVVAAETVLSEVEGAAGRLVIRGCALDQLAGSESFEAVVHRLFEGFFEDLPAPEALTAAIGRARAEVFAEVAGLDARLVGLGSVEAVRALIARLPDGESLDTALRLVAAPAVFTAAVSRKRQGLEPIAPDASLGHARDMLRMARGSMPSEAAAALDAYLVTVCDHGLNASTFAARVTASTRAGLTSAVLAGISALKGPLHGGAPGPVLQMLDEIGAPQNARAWLEAALDRGDRLMGFGHRIYRVRDPRADALKRAVARLAAEGEGAGGSFGRLAFAEAVEAAALEVLKARKPNRSLQTNVEFYTALLLEALDFPAEAFTGVFAAGRVAGWIAHAREQLAGGRLIRPQSRYVGPAPREAA